jgi:hypothetical protein
MMHNIIGGENISELGDTSFAYEQSIEESTSFPIELKWITQRRITVTVRSDLTVNELKDIALKVSGAPTDQPMRLLWDKKVLEDDNATLKQVAIKMKTKFRILYLNNTTLFFI